MVFNTCIQIAITVFVIGLSGITRYNQLTEELFGSIACVLMCIELIKLCTRRDNIPEPEIYVIWILIAIAIDLNVFKEMLPTNISQYV